MSISHGPDPYGQGLAREDTHTLGTNSLLRVPLPRWRRLRTCALGVHLLSRAKLATALALRDRSTFLLDLKEGPVGMGAGRGAMAFDTRFTG